jgi:hypothetical protein
MGCFLFFQVDEHQQKRPRTPVKQERDEQSLT